MLGSSVLLKLNDELVIGQGDSTLNLANSLLEKAAGENGAKQYLYDEQDGDLSVTVMAEKQQEMALFNIWTNKMEVECYYGGVNDGDIYYYFKGLVTSFNKGDPAGGLSTIALSLKINGKVTMKVVANEEEVYYTLTVNVDEVMGSVVISPNYGSYQNGEIVSIKGVANEGYILDKFTVNGATMLPDANGNIFLTMLQDTVVDVILLEKYNAEIYFDENWVYPIQAYFYVEATLNSLLLTRLGGGSTSVLVAKRVISPSVMINSITISTSFIDHFQLYLVLKRNGVVKFRSVGFYESKTFEFADIEIDEIQILAENITTGDNVTMSINAPIELFFN